MEILLDGFNESISFAYVLYITAEPLGIPNVTV